MIGGAKGIGIGIDFGIPNQYCRATSKPYIEKDVLDSLRVVASAYGKSNDDADRSIVKNLVDASNPFIISNAAFKLNSGFGKYEVDFAEYRSGNFIYVSRISPNSILATTDGSGEKALLAKFPSNENDDINEYKVEIKLTEGVLVVYKYIDNTGTLKRKYLNTSGIYDLPKSYISKLPSEFNDSIGFSASGVGEIYLSQIPSFEGAFVTDGVNDLITSTKTVQEMLEGSNEITVVSMIHGIGSKNAYTNVLRESGSNYIKNTSTADGKTGIYGYTCKDTTKSIITDILGDKNDYKLEYIQTTSPNNINSVFSVAGWKNSTSSMVSYSVAWYWTIIANKVLTTDQINQVIAYFNLDRTLKPDILCNTIKQGITNENHAEFGDKLIDFSGNGRDIQLKNIAWKGDSGIGKYNVDFDSWIPQFNIADSVHTSNKLCVTRIKAPQAILYTRAKVNSMKAEVKGSQSLELFYQYVDKDDNMILLSLQGDGIYDLPASIASANNYYTGFRVSNYTGECDITITQIPSHAGALCLDGVNDFGKVTGMPIYKDYTFIIDRKFLNETFANQVCLVSKSKVASEIENGGAFIVDNISVNSIINPYSFYKTTSLPGLNTFDRQIVFQSKYKYLDKDIAAGTATDSDTLWLGTFRDNDSRFANVAIYSLMSFPYSMSEFLIERQLKKHKLGTLYPDMVEFRPVIKANNDYEIVYTAIIKPNNWQEISVGDYVTVGESVAIQIKLNNPLEVTNVSSNSLADVSFYKEETGDNVYTIYGRLLDGKSPQKINITIDEYIRFEDIVQPYPVLLRFKDENGNEVSWGGKFRVDSTITRIGSAADSNLLPNIYNIFGLLLNGNQVTSSKVIVEKTMVFKAKSAYIFDNNEPKCILSPRLLRIPNSSYKILGYIPDISGHGNHGKINNSAYAEGSGVNEDGSYQFDGVDDFVTIPTLSSGGKQVLMKVNSLNSDVNVIYDQRLPTNMKGTFAIICDNNLAYSSWNTGQTYIDGILNKNIIGNQLVNITHNLTITNDGVTNNNSKSPFIGKSTDTEKHANMSLYDFMLFDNVSTDDKIKQLNEYVGIEGNVWGTLTQLSNSTLISNETLIKNE